MPNWMRRTKAILLQRCPRCLEGPVFSGLTTMNERCPRCGHKFAREAGYFLGAMYASYCISIPVLGLLTLVIHWMFLPHWGLENAIFVALLPFLLLVPAIFRYSRIFWMHIDMPPQKT